MAFKSGFRKLLFFSFLFSFSTIHAQEEIVDSLIHVLKATKDDTLKLHILNKIIENSNDDNVWPAYNEQMGQLGLSLMKNKNEVIRKRGMYHYGNSLINTGYIFNNKGMLDSSITYYQKGADIMSALGNKRGVAATLNNIGYVFKSQGDILTALDYYHRSLKIYESVNDSSGIANSLNNLAIIYNRQGDIKTAIKYNLKCLEIQEKLGNKRGVEISMGNLASLYRHKNQYDLALEYLNKSLKIQEEIGDKSGIAYSYTNIGNIYEDQKKNDEALKYYTIGYEILKGLDDKPQLTSATINLGMIYLKLNDLNKAYDFAQKSVALAKEIGYVYELEDAANLMAKVYKKRGNYKEALEMHELYMKMKDSALNESTKKASLQKQFQYSYERKAAADSVKNMEAEKVKDAQINAQESKLKQQQTLKYALFGGIALMIIFSLYVLNRYKNTQQKNRIIEGQKAIVDEKQKEIIDSITYAKRIQLALLKEEEYVSKHLPEHFIFYRPKDIVSGDFYWSLEKTINGIEKYWYLTAADCTGHGVPGAFLTMLGTSFLNEINAVAEILSPAEILDQLRSRIIKDLNQTGRIGDNKDGMDMSIIRMNLSTYELEWAGANNPLWIIKKTGEDYSIVEIKADKQPIGYSHTLEPFKNHVIQLEKEDQLIMFTDGYADQFGGDKKKKFKRSQLKELILNNAKFPPDMQKQIVEKVFDEWKGNLEQIDDVCIIGIRI
jgi:serine phosphatase RsbU (regulator of sigma subunit)/tetratricopeptide (TPR) repeat protein